MHSKLLSRMFHWFYVGTLAASAPLIVAHTVPESTTVKEIRIIQAKPADHPLALLKKGVFEGWARVSLAIDEEGKLIDALILGYSHPEFAHATLDALHKWKFTPALIDGKPVSSVTQLNFNFNRDSDGAVVLPVTLMEFVDQRSITQPEENKLVRLDKLDGIPVPLHIVSPAYSAENAQDHSGEKVIVKFYIDEEGRVRLPTLKYADSPEIARQALTAVAQWRFQPPTYKGKPVITQASQEFRF